MKPVSKPKEKAIEKLTPKRQPTIDEMLDEALDETFPASDPVSLAQPKKREILTATLHEYLMVESGSRRFPIRVGNLRSSQNPACVG
jgi:hypothetical protein